MSHRVVAGIVALMAPAMVAQVDDGAAENSASVTEDVLALVKAYLYQDTIEIEGAEFTAAFFASEEKNHLHEYKLESHPYAEIVRQSLLGDKHIVEPEYRVRSLLAQSRARELPGDSRNYQSALWSVFLDDPRFVRRILMKIQDALDARGDAEPRLTIPDVAPFSNEAPAVLDTLYDRMQKAMEQRELREGCGQKLITVASDFADLDPLLVSDLLRIYLKGTPKSGDALAAELAGMGWAAASPTRP